MKIFRISIGILGLLLIGFALLSTPLGLRPPGIGAGKVNLVIIGLLLCSIAIAGRRIVDWYKVAGIILLNIILLFWLIEFGAFVMLRFNDINASSIKFTNAYHNEQAWTQQLSYDYGNINSGYYPHTLWRARPQQTATLNIDENQLRVTPEANCIEDAYTVLMFGGSTMWGWGAPDWGTIPAYLQVQLDQTLYQPVCVINYGEEAYNSTQNLIDLMFALQRGDRPDLVIFYEGSNDIIYGLESGQPVHWQAPQIIQKLDGVNPLVSLIQSTAISRLVNQVFSPNINNSESSIPILDFNLGPNLNSLDDELAGLAIENYKLVAALASAYDFEYLYFWQPIVGVGEKSLTPPEQDSYQYLEENNYIASIVAIYTQLEEEAQQSDRMYSLTDIFDDYDEQIYVDNIHITLQGNEIVAQYMMSVIQSTILNENGE